MFLAACGSAHVASSAGATPTLSSAGATPTLSSAGPTPTLSVPAVVTVNWDKPLPNAVDVVLGSEAQSSAVAGLAFALVTPRLPRSASLLRVSDPAAVPAEGRAAAFRYDFSGAPGHSADGRVVVYEGVPHITQQGLEDIAANPPGDAGDYSVVTVAGLKVLLNQHGGVGRVRFIHDGVLFDVTGPADPAARVLDLALNIVAPPN